MPNNFPGDITTFPANVRAVGDGEALDGAHIDVTASDAADRTAYLKDKVDPLAPPSGGYVTNKTLTVNTIAYADVTGASVSQTVKAGDVVNIDWFGVLTGILGTTTAGARLMISENGGSFVEATEAAATSLMMNTRGSPVSPSAHHVVSAGGTLVAKVQANSSAGDGTSGTNCTIFVSAMRLNVARP